MRMPPEQTQPASWGSIARAGSFYFLLVFLVGFALGTARVLIVIPAIGERAAELSELPLMVLAAWFCARWVARRLRVPAVAGKRLAMGAVALSLLVGAEILLVLQLRGLTLEQYLTERDPVSGSAYVFSLLLFALMPWLVATRNATAAGKAAADESAR